MGEDEQLRCVEGKVDLMLLIPRIELRRVSLRFELSQLHAANSITVLPGWQSLDRIFFKAICVPLIV